MYLRLLNFTIRKMQYFHSVSITSQVYSHSFFETYALVHSNEIFNRKFVCKILVKSNRKKVGNGFEIYLFSFTIQTIKMYFTISVTQYCFLFSGGKRVLKPDKQ